MKQVTIDGKTGAIISTAILIIALSLASTGDAKQLLTNIIKTSADLTSVDADNNGIIDNSEKANTILYSGISGINKKCEAEEFAKGINNNGVMCESVHEIMNTLAQGCEKNTVYPYYHTGSGGTYNTPVPCPDNKELVFFKTDWYTATYYCC
jgi:hypothetical protein